MKYCQPEPAKQGREPNLGILGGMDLGQGEQGLQNQRQIHASFRNETLAVSSGNPRPGPVPQLKLLDWETSGNAFSTYGKDRMNKLV